MQKLLPKELTDTQAKRLPVDIQENQKRYRAIATVIIERNNWLLHRDAFEAVERTQRFIDSIGGFQAFERMQRAQELAEKLDALEKYERAQRPLVELLQRLDTCWPGASDLLEMVDERHDSDKSDFMAAVKRFARTLDSRLVDQKARRVLTDTAQREGKTSLSLLRQRIFPEALILVLNDSDRPQAMRIIQYKKWVKRRDGRKSRVKPINRPWHEFIIWVRRETYKAASAIILGLDYPVSGPDILKKSTTLDDRYYNDEETSPLEALLAEETKIQVEQQLLPALSRQEKSFFCFIENGGSPAELNISDENVHQLISRIRKKSRSISGR
jgi:hypothetical protein